MSALNPFAWLSRWLDRRIDARIAGWNACRQADFFEMDGDAERLAQWEPAARAAGWKPRRERSAA